MKIRELALVVVVGGVGVLAGGARGVVITPTTFSDVPISGLGVVNAAGQITNQGGAISLRSAIIATNAVAGPDTINLNAGTYTLTIAGSDNTCLGGDLDINDSLTINGNGATIQMVPPGPPGDYKVIGVNQDGTHPGLTISLNNVTITGGRNDFIPTGNFEETGGGIDFYLTGTGNNFSMTNCTVMNNTATGSSNSRGGGINVDSTNTGTVGGASAGMVTFTNCTFSNNTSDREGGGLSLHADKHDVLLTNCTVTGNHTSAVSGNGGGITIAHSFGGTVTMNGGSVSNNMAAAGGGGINITYNGNASINNVAISGNSSLGSAGANSIGGGVMFSQTGAAGISAVVTVTGCTITGNHANGASVGQGGGVYMLSAYPATVSKCTITGNTALNSGGGLAVAAGGAGVLTANFNRIVGNTSGSLIGIANSGVASVENNWWGTNTPATVAAGTADFNPWIKLAVTASPTSVVLGATSSVTADMSHNSDNTLIASANLTAIAGLPVAWGATLGSMTGTQGTIQAAGTATGTYNAGNTPGAGSASATVDGVTASASIGVTCPTITASVSGGGTVCAGTSSTVTVSVSGGVPPYTVTLNNGGGTLMGSSPLNFSVSPAGQTVYSVSSATDSRGCAITASGSATVMVNPVPGAPTGAMASHRFVCPGGATTLSATAPSGSVVDWFTGSCGGTAVAGGASPTVNPTVATTYYARSRTTAGGCVSATCATVSVTICRVDFNCSGTLEVQDIFDFLNAWFAGSPSADYNGGGLSVQDIFDYLNAWFAGC
ncbi:MAG TPA: GC-type dockerin domain-anchored protein [Phycisphaerales bacterium]|nr:GC-type dockerin domain-anchored protein [Phycisphaerales bacterium]